MANPVLAEVTRGSRVESRHCGAAAIVDAGGKRLWSAGDVTHPVFPRSAVKAIQALPFVESGAADAFGFGPRELALAQASHWGEPAHVEAVAAMLAAIGLGEADLQCGVHPPSNAAAAAALIREGRPPGQLHNNCSGKHANFLAFARHAGIDHRGYVAAAHPVQEAVRDALESVIGAHHDAGHRATDGCSIPTYAVPLDALATGFARFAAGEGLSPRRAEAARRLFDAAVSEPFFVAGTGRFDTLVMEALGGRVLVKYGAEGVYCAAIPEFGIGIAAKCDDGATRGVEAMMAGILARLMPEHEDALHPFTHVAVKTRWGIAVGEIRVHDEAFADLAAAAVRDV